ncbi:hypothetical protein GP486_004219 [Trichoglossum hirsutum]|uniref:Uncharacterized protein n=1 Tax=Trichoglossum hirsutum TaxID=265104 RepID=A0A9P8LBG4_9PEZI|nr:hypothetical protein GP486_004219 [Trichoglossum hirsutum]
MGTAGVARNDNGGKRKGTPKPVLGLEVDVVYMQRRIPPPGQEINGRIYVGTPLVNNKSSSSTVGKRTGCSGGPVLSRPNEIVTGVDSQEEITMTIKLKGKEYKALVDSGASRNYMSPEVMRTKNLRGKKIPAYALTGLGRQHLSTVSQEVLVEGLTINGEEAAVKF